MACACPTWSQTLLPPPSWEAGKRTSGTPARPWLCRPASRRLGVLPPASPQATLRPSSSRNRACQPTPRPAPLPARGRLVPQVPPPGARPCRFPGPAQGFPRSPRRRQSRPGGPASGQPDGWTGTSRDRPGAWVGLARPQMQPRPGARLVPGPARPGGSGLGRPSRSRRALRGGRRAGDRRLGSRGSRGGVWGDRGGGAASLACSPAKLLALAVWERLVGGLRSTCCPRGGGGASVPTIIFRVEPLGHCARNGCAECCMCSLATGLPPD